MVRIISVLFAFCALAIPSTSAQTLLTTQPPDIEVDAFTDSELHTWRNAFLQAETRSEIQAFETLMDKAYESYPEQSVSSAFRATAKLLGDVISWNPVVRYSGFKMWTRELNRAVQRDPDNPDIRFLRLMIASNSPGFLGFKESIEADCILVSMAVKGGFWNSDAAYEAFVKQRVTVSCGSLETRDLPGKNNGSNLSNSSQ